MTNPLTVSGTISSTIPQLGADIDGAIVLGGDTTFQNVQLVSGSNDGLNLNGNDLTVVDNQSNGNDTFGISDNITGAGTFNINVAEDSLFLDGINTYSGTTNVISVGNITTLSDGNTAGLLGTSSIVVSPNATLSLNAVSSYSFTNPITFQAATENANVYGDQLIVWTQNNTDPTVTIPNITLEGNTRFDVNDSPGSVVVNLAGITANGHCIQYGDDTNARAKYFENGPTGCVIAGNTSSTPVPTSQLKPLMMALRSA